jgi:hypothetical protein
MKSTHILSLAFALILISVATVGCLNPSRTLRNQESLTIRIEQGEITTYLLVMQKDWARLYLGGTEAELIAALPPASMNVGWHPEFEHADAVFLAVYADFLRGRYLASTVPSVRSAWRIALQVYCEQLRSLLQAGKEAHATKTEYVEAALMSSLSILKSLDEEKK